MNTVHATYRDGQIIPAQPVDWPDGTELVIEPLRLAASLGIRDEDWPTDPEGIARHLALMDTIPPPEPESADEVECKAARQVQKEFERAAFDNHAEKLRGMWE